jgi:hypothetical protein
MLYRTNFLVTLLTCFSFSLLSTGIINAAHAEQKVAEEKQQTAPKTIYGKVTDVIEAAGYTYAEVDTGKDKVWAATTTSSVKIGDMIAFSTEMPMENFHSKSMKRDFSVVYFVNHFITGKESQNVEATATASPHGQISQTQAALAIKGINKLEGGYTIAEIYASKQDLNGKTIRLRGQVTRVNNDVMGKNWLHIRDSSSLDDLTVTTSSKVAIDDTVVIEGKLALDKDFSYGYVYPLIVEDASITKE